VRDGKLEPSTGAIKERQAFFDYQRTGNIDPDDLKRHIRLVRFVFHPQKEDEKDEETLRNFAFRNHITLHTIHTYTHTYTLSLIFSHLTLQLSFSY
jgi:hypothetical protein